MTRKIVILMDGTSNEIHADRSNILRLYGTLKKSDDQLVYYDPGIGTFGGDFPFSREYGEAKEVVQRIFGWGLDDNVKEAYRFLVENHSRDKTKDEIYLFGFSRGAYTVRVLAGFLRAFGLIEKRNLNLLDYAYRAYKTISDKAGDAAESQAGRKAVKDRSFDEIRLYERVLDPCRVPVRFMGVFDTVSSVIERGRVGWQLRKHAFTHSNSMVQTVRHAVATDERRRMFRPDLWTPGQSYLTNPFDPHPEPQDFREVWFPGVHSDVGGGYPEDESHLAKIPLAWMIHEAAEAGLNFNMKTVEQLVLGRDGDKPHKKYVAPDPLEKAHESMSGAWRLAEYIPKRVPRETPGPSFLGWYLPLMEPRVVPDGACLHRSVLMRQAAGKIVRARLPVSYSVEEWMPDALLPPSVGSDGPKDKPAGNGAAEIVA